MSISNDFWQQTRKAVAINKARGYFALPPFEIADETPDRGSMSRILTQFNFEAPKNFTLVAIPDVPSTTLNFILCIKYRIGGTVYRYKIWTQSYYPDLTNDHVYVPFYDGQIIRKNFILEVWSVNDADLPGNVLPAQLGEAVNFYTSWRKVKTTLSEADTNEMVTGTEVEAADIALPAAFPLIYPDDTIDGDNT